ERLAFYDAERGRHAAHFEIVGVDVFMLDEAGEHVERAAVGRVKHVGRTDRRRREFHRPGLLLVAQRIDARLFHDCNGLDELPRILEKAAPEYEHAVGARAVGKKLSRHIAVVVRRNDQVLAALALVGTRQADIAAPGAPVNLALRADRPLPEIIENALQSRWYFDHHHAVFLQVQIT